MATGVEAAGIILGSIPLLIAALEHYEDVAQRTVEFFHWRRPRRKLTEEIIILRASFDQAVRILLTELCEPDELAEMVEDPCSDLWTTGPVSDSLRVALGPTYSPFIYTVRDIGEILVSIAKHLNIEGVQQDSVQLEDILLANLPVASSSHPKQNFEFGKRVVFTMRKKGIKANLERLEDCTKRIDKWTERAGKAQANNVTSRSKLHFTASLSTIQGNASRLHGALTQSWCTVRPSHSTFLLLEKRLQRPRRKRRGHHDAARYPTPEHNCFRLSVRGECCVHLPQFNTEFRVAELVSKSPSVSRVRFDPRALQSTTHDPPYGDPSVLPQADEFCHYLKLPIHAPAGFYVDEKGNLREYAAGQSTICFVENSITLETLLSNSRGKLSWEERYSLAITLVASLFQLGHTPWLESTWSKKDIAFLGASESLPSLVDLNFPYLIQEFNHQTQSAKQKTTDCSKLLSLAIMLLEINFGKPLEQMRQPENPPGKNVTHDETVEMQTATRWFKGEKLTQGFESAIRTGLQEYLNSDANLNDAEYCDAIKAKMLQPLEEELQYLSFGPP